MVCSDDSALARFLSRSQNPDELKHFLETASERAIAAWPGIKMSADEFTTCLAEHIPDGPDPLDVLARLHLEDLYLACACAQGFPEAILAFQKEHGASITETLCRRGLNATESADAWQNILVKLFTANTDQQPRIRQFSGIGPLRKWLQVIASREAYDLFSKKNPAATFGVDSIGQIPAGSEDLEMVMLKESCRESFREALRSAFAALTKKQRNLIRYSTLEGLSFDQIGGIYQVNRSTISRWLAYARKTLLAETRRALGESLRITSSEVQSILRLAQSQLDISLQKYLD